MEDLNRDSQNDDNDIDNDQDLDGNDNNDNGEASANDVSEAQKIKEEAEALRAENKRLADDNIAKATQLKTIAQRQSQVIDNVPAGKDLYEELENARLEGDVKKAAAISRQLSEETVNKAMQKTTAFNQMMDIRKNIINDLTPTQKGLVDNISAGYIQSGKTYAEAYAQAKKDLLGEIGGKNKETMEAVPESRTSVNYDKSGQRKKEPKIENEEDKMFDDFSAKRKIR